MKTSILFLCLFILSSCSSDNFIFKKYAFEKPDGTEISTYFLAGDHFKKKSNSQIRFSGFEQEDVNKNDEILNLPCIQEIQYKNLTDLFQEYDFLLVSLWYGCQITDNYELTQFIKLKDELNVDTNKIGVLLISTTYDPSRLLYLSSKYPLQKYVLSNEIYGSKIVPKTLNFLKQVSPNDYLKEKYFLSEKTVFFLFNKGEDVVFLDYTYGIQNNVKSIKNFDLARDEIKVIINENKFRK